MAAFRDQFHYVVFSWFLVGGGTPTQASERELDVLLGSLRRWFRLGEGADFAVEATPATLTPGKLSVLSRYGVGRVDLGIDTTDPTVLARAGRAGCGRRKAEGALGLVAAFGITCDVSLLFGVEGQTPESFLSDVRWVRSLAPPRVRLYGFDAAPRTSFNRSGKTLDAGRRREIRAALAAGRRLLERGGYEPDDGAWRPIGSVLGIGSSARSLAFGAARYEHLPSSGWGAGMAPIPPSVGVRVRWAAEGGGKPCERRGLGLEALEERELECHVLIRSKTSLGAVIGVPG